MASIVEVKGKWRALVRRKGHPSYCKTFATKTQAEKWARAIEADIDRDLVPKAQDVLGHRLLVSDLIDRYRKLRGSSRPIDDTTSEHYMLQMLAAYLGDRDAATLTPDDLVGYARTRADMGAGPYTINMDISKLGTVMRLVGAALHIELPDVVGKARPLLNHLKLIGGGGKRERRPTDDELVRICSQLESKRGKVYADAVRFAVLTAMRRGEITGLLWGDLDAERRLVLVRDRKDPREKMGNDQLVPLLNGAWELVQAQKEEGDRIFPIHPQTLSKYFTETCRELAIPDLHFHDLRHHGVSLLFEQGYRIEQVALVSGHKSWQHLKRYTNLRPEDLHHGPHADAPRRA